MIIVNRKKRIAAFVLDTIGRLLFFFFGIGSAKRTLPREVKTILAIRLAYIGDVILTIPAIKPLAERFPEAKVIFLTSDSARSVVENNPYIDEVITYDAPWFYSSNIWKSLRQWYKLIRVLRRRRFDMAIDFRGDLRNILFLLFPCGARFKVGYDITGGGYMLDHIVSYRGKKHKVDFHLDMVRDLGWDGVFGDRLNLYPDHEDERSTQMELERSGIGNGDLVVGLHPGGRVSFKSWDTANYAALGDRLIKRCHAKIVITGGPHEVALGDRVLSMMKGRGSNLAGKVTLRQLQVLLKRMNLFVTNDTAVLHVASGANVPTVAIFGPSEVWDTGPLSEKNKVMMRTMTCREACDTYQCGEANYHACLKSITPEEVMAACEDMIAK